jgi:diphthamide biosynthesis methyltransferase
LNHPTSSMLYLVGLGLSDEKDVTVRGLEAIKGSERVYLEAYTSILGVGKDRLVRALSDSLTALSTDYSSPMMCRKLSMARRLS